MCRGCNLLICRCLAHLYIAEVGHSDGLRVPLRMFAVMRGHTLPHACCTQGCIHSCFLACAGKMELLCVSDKSVYIGKADMESSIPPDLKALPGSACQEECAKLPEVQDDMWDVLENCQVLILHTLKVKGQVLQT